MNDAMISEIELVSRVADNRGFLAVTPNGETCFVNAHIAQRHGLSEGSKLIGTLTPHKFPDRCKWFAEWVVPARHISLKEINAAYAIISERFAVQASEIGVDAGDILYHAGRVQRLIGHVKGDTVNSGDHVLYTCKLDAVISDVTEPYVDAG